MLFSLLNAVGISALLLVELRSAVFRKVFSDRRRMRRNLAYLVASFGVAMLLHRIGSYLPFVLPKNWSWHAPLWVELPLVFLLAEWMSWMLHWAKHENNYFWRFHCQHHKEDQFSPWLVTHTYAPEVLLSGTVISATVLACGFSKLSLDSYLLFYSLVNVYQHSSLPHSLGFLDKIIINPAYHRHHHGGERVNFGSTLTVWDYLFKTMKRPASRHEAVNPPPVDQTPEPFGFVDEMLYPLKPSRWIETQLEAPKVLSQK
jgi:sterol desaturase/sphingolipid hydroxylase (fatty acid hydroxylase superfamily)